jgi:hypothetical protein
MEHTLQHAHRHRHSRREMGAGGAAAASRTSIMERSRVLVARASESCVDDSQPGCTKATVIPKMVIVLAVV